MSYKLIIGNNFVLNSPKRIFLMDKEIFSIGEDNNGVYVDSEIVDKNGKNILSIKKNKLVFCMEDFKIKKDKRDHILVLNSQGEIVLESRVYDKKTLIVSGIFTLDEFSCIITQNYILLSNGKRIMHSRVDSENKNICVGDDGIKVIQ
ncbi:MAG TPA: hypothetical protein VK250_10850 [Nitrososphaeraceae archaeon]|nr:hypothetical protein [Nitrososphaeraceae archaeon]